ncbi:MAG: putative viral replication protein [Cressdnaviricota sp.]|nr:MAG: putative viral replication protein [Cressdnaviricota sp.]
MTSRSRKYVFTWNNYPADYKESLDPISCIYIVAGEEVAPTTLTPHLQGFVYFKNAKTSSAVRLLFPGCHVETARGTPNECDSYCRKIRVGDEPNANVYCRGDLPLSNKEKGEAEKERWADALAAAKEGRIDDIPPDIVLRQYSSIRRIERDYMPPVDRLEGPCGVWIWGAAGCGKSKSVLDAYPDVYPKPRSVWWDGYQREEVVLVDDVDVFDVKLGGLIKHWADAYPFIGEVKGGSQKIRPKKLIVTSQYKIEEIWGDSRTREALLRRFVVVEKKLGQNIII